MQILKNRYMDLPTLKTLPSSPAFVLDSQILRNNLDTVSQLRQQSGCKVLYSVKALPLAYVLNLAKNVVDGFSVSSLFEAKLANESLAGLGSIHITTPGLRDDEWPELSNLVSHVSFNSISQQQRLSPLTTGTVSMGLRINPKLSFLADARYDPSGPSSKLGASIDEVWQSANLATLGGLHVHNYYSATDFQPLLKTVAKLRQYFGKDLAKLAWLNLGGGVLFKQIGNHQGFIEMVKQLQDDYGLEVFIEPGKAVVGDAAYLVATVIDTFVSDGKTVAILDTSVNHNPEVFEYQRPAELCGHDPKGRYPVVLAGSTCLAGDVLGEYRLPKPLTVGERVVFKQLGAYSLIKAHRFNGYNLPDLYRLEQGQATLLKQYTYHDYQQQWRSQ